MRSLNTRNATMHKCNFVMEERFQEPLDFKYIRMPLMKKKKKENQNRSHCLRESVKLLGFLKPKRKHCEIQPKFQKSFI